MPSTQLKLFKLWTIECIASAIVFISFFDEFNTSIGDMTRRDYWICCTSAASVLISIIGLLASVIRKERGPCKPESLLVFLLAIVWCVSITVAILGPFGVGDRDSDSDSDSDKQTFLSSFQFISFHPNVYFFSLWSFTVSMLLVASWCKEFLSGSDLSNSSTTQWVLLQAFGFFTMLSALNFRDQTFFGEFTDLETNNMTKNDLNAMVNELSAKLGAAAAAETVTIGNDTDPFEGVFKGLIDDGSLNLVSPCEKATYSCKLIYLAIGLPATTAVVAMVMTPIRNTNKVFQADVSIVLFLFWLPSLVLLTVTPGPATRAGNLYFGIYICYFLVLRIFISSTTHRRAEGSESTAAESEDSESSDTVNRDDIWEAAFGRLDKKTHTPEVRDRTGSSDSLFDDVEDWSDVLKEHVSRSQVSDSQSSVTRKLWGPVLHFQGHYDDNKGASGSSSQPQQQTADVKPEEWDRRVKQLFLWFILFTMGIVLLRTFSIYEKRRKGYIISSISIAASCVGIATSLRNSRIADVVESVSILLVFCNWVTGVVLFLKSSGHVFGFSASVEKLYMLLGERPERPLEDPNVFLGVWISMISAILLVTNRCKASLATADWILVATASTALLISSTDNIGGELDDESMQACGTDFTISCRKQTFAKDLGTATLCISLAMILLSRRLGPIWQVLFSVPLVFTWGFGVLYLTFSKHEVIPAGTFFSFWGGICLSLELATVNAMALFRQSEKENEAEDDCEAENKTDDNLPPEESKASAPLEQSGAILDPSHPLKDTPTMLSFRDEYPEHSTIAVPVIKEIKDGAEVVLKSGIDEVAGQDDSTSSSVDTREFVDCSEVFPTQDII